jgi:flagellar hook assembly protein FlgD
MFEHNQPGTRLDIQIQIFTISGKLVKTIETFSNNDGFRIDGITWDGRDEYGDKIGKGVYIYKVKVKSQEGAIAEKFEKLVILN